MRSSPHKKIWIRLWNPESGFGISLVLPALLILGFIVLYPLLTSLKLAFFTKNLLKPFQGVPFVGFDNFRYLFFKSDAFWVAVKNSIVLTAGTVSSSLILGLIVALILNKPFKISPNKLLFTILYSHSPCLCCGRDKSRPYPLSVFCHLSSAY